MFYTITSKIPFISEKNNLLLIFIIGSIAYILLHYYLWSSQQLLIVNKLRPYLYYILLIDLSIAYYLLKSNIKASNKEFTKDEKLEAENDLLELQKSRNENKQICQDNNCQIIQEDQEKQQNQNQLEHFKYIQQQRQLELQKQSQLQKQEIENQQSSNLHQNDDKEIMSNQSPFKTIDEINNEKKQLLKNKLKKKKEYDSSSKSSKSSTKSISDESSHKKSKSKKTKKVESKNVEIDEDTNIPIL
jgi:hypothetical protein